MDILWQRLQDLWNGILDLTAKLVIPDWAGLVALIPIGLAALVALWFAIVIMRFARAGPTRRGKRRLPPAPPPGVHAGGGSLAPFFTAIGAFLLFAGIVIGGTGLVLGIAALVATLLYWGREAIADYEHVEPPAQLALPAVVPRGPPPGVHMPGPSFRPILGALGAAALLAGLVVKGSVLVAGLLILVTTLIGWLGDARREWAATVDADQTGHLATGPRPRYPVGTIAACIVILVVAVVVNAGILPPSSNAGGAGASPGASGAAPSGPAPSGSGAAPGGPAADVHIVAKNVAFTTRTANAPANKPFTIAFDNEDQGTPHNVAIHKDSPSGQQVFMGEIVPGVKTVVYNVPALATGTYAYVCSVHSNMTGTLTVK
jgi:plastocyanin